MKPAWSLLAREALMVAVYNTAIALFLAALTSYDLATDFIYAQCIGCAIYAFVRGSGLLWGQPQPGAINGLIGIPLGFAVGFTLATWISGLSLTEMTALHPQAFVIAGAASLLFGVLGTWHFHDEAKLFAAQAEARAERLLRAEQESLATHAELARLQAQIEPHFLFNTLSNVVGLIDTDPAAARTMLIDLTALLRTVLARTRRREVSLGEELDLLRAYLGIMAVRMGERLSWRIDATADILAARLPPLLVQPLVENAIRHGLEPQPAGGSLAVNCRREDACLVIEVADSGGGFAATDGNGVGLANVRERLRACYGERASLALESSAGGGISARLSLPFACAC
ncbi:MAG: histidine kinase [Rhodocyclaceae bacterium]|nr:histidine kinase [Rhodocyclaceae bacterium]